MNDVKGTAPRSELDREEEPNRGPNLTLIYSLIVLAVLVAIALAAFIVVPFYHRR